jgi:hypothetical protein
MFDVVAANQLSWAVYGGHQYTSNHARLVFLDPDRDVFFREWDKVASGIVAQLRAAAILDPGNAGLTNLVGELTTQSPEFRRRWAKAEVRERTGRTFLVTHAEVGDLDLVYEAFRPNSNPNLLLTVLWPAAGSDTADKLAVLGSRTSEPAPRRSTRYRNSLSRVMGISLPRSRTPGRGAAVGTRWRGCWPPGSRR